MVDVLDIWELGENTRDLPFYLTQLAFLCPVTVQDWISPVSGIYAMRCLRLSGFPGRLWSCQKLRKSLNCTCIAAIWESEGLKARTDGQLAGENVDLVNYKECTNRFK